MDETRLDNWTAAFESLRERMANFLITLEATADAIPKVFEKHGEARGYDWLLDYSDGLVAQFDLLAEGMQNIRNDLVREVAEED